MFPEGNLQCHFASLKQLPRFESINNLFISNAAMSLYVKDAKIKNENVKN